MICALDAFDSGVSLREAAALAVGVEGTVGGALAVAGTVVAVAVLVGAVADAVAVAVGSGLSSPRPHPATNHAPSDTTNTRRFMP